MPTFWPTTYQQDLTNKNFVNLLRRDKKVDIDYLIDMVLKHKHPLDLAKLRKSKTKLHIVLTDAETGKRKIVSNHHEFEEIYEELRAASALPLLYDAKVKVGDNYYIDGGVADYLPIDVAIKLGCTDLVVIMTTTSSLSFRKTTHQNG